MRMQFQYIAVSFGWSKLERFQIFSSVVVNPFERQHNKWLLEQQIATCFLWLIQIQLTLLLVGRGISRSRLTRSRICQRCRLETRSDGRSFCLDMDSLIYWETVNPVNPNLISINLLVCVQNWNLYLIFFTFSILTNDRHANKRKIFANSRNLPLITRKAGPELLNKVTFLNSG